MSSTKEDEIQQQYRYLEVTKLYEEIAQLRNQQFIIGTLALSGTGAAFWVLPGQSGLANESTPVIFTLSGSVPDAGTKGELIVSYEAKPTTYITFTEFLSPILEIAAFLFILGFLFYWSISLREQIVIISEYLKQKGLSEWERWYSVFDSKPDVQKLKESQTGLVELAFYTYGTIICFVGSISILDSEKFEKLLEHEWVKLIHIIVPLWIFYILFVYMTRNQFNRRYKESVDKERITIPSRVAKYHNIQQKYKLPDIPQD